MEILFPPHTLHPHEWSGKRISIPSATRCLRRVMSRTAVSGKGPILEEDFRTRPYRPLVSAAGLARTLF